MRIISGKLGGLSFRSPHSRSTRPMNEKIRGAIFNSLGSIDGLSVLDSFAGSGALAYEAISRGASRAMLIERDTNAQRTIEENIMKLGLRDQTKLIRTSVSNWLQNNPELKFDIIFCDPPYNKLQINILQQLTCHVVDDGLLILSWPGKIEIPKLDRLFIIKIRDFGDAHLVFYRKNV